MIQKIFILLGLLAALTISTGCATTDQEQDPELAEALDDFEDEADSEEAGDDELAEDDESGDEGFEDEEFAEEEFEETEEALEEEPAEEELAEEDLEEFQEEEEQPTEQLVEEEPLEPVAQNAEFVELTNIKFIANKNGGTVVIDTTGSPTFTSRVNEETNQFVVEIQNSFLPDKLKRPFIMNEFESSVGAINAYQDPGSKVARIVVQMKDMQNPPNIFAEGSSVLVVPAAAPKESMVVEGSQEGLAPGALEGPKKGPKLVFTEEEKAAQALGARTLDEFLLGGNSRYFGEKISIETGKDTDIRDVINLIAEDSGANIIISDQVKGTAQLKLREVPWDQALVILMKSKKLGYVREGNIIRIATLEELRAETKAAKEVIESQRALTPLRVKVIPVSYAKVEDLVKQIAPFLTEKRGSVDSDKRTSSIIVKDTDEAILRISRLIQELDIPPAQVMIEGKVVEATEDFQKSVGISWNSAGAPVSIDPRGGPNGAPIDITASVTSNPSSLGGATSGSLDLSIGTFKFLGDLSATLALQEREDNVRILSSPRIVTLNNEEALISQSGEVIQTTQTIVNGESTVSTQAREFKLELKVVPQITADGSVIMEVEIIREFPGQAVNDTQPINSREAKTKVLVKNGQTSVIGGIFQSDQGKTESGVPVLKDIPVFGWLFKHKSNTKSKNELLIFLTPRILNLQDQIISDGKAIDLKDAMETSKNQ